MKTIPLADINSLQPVVAYLNTLGVQVNRYLDATKISSELMAMGNSKITKRQVYQFLSEASQREGLPDLGYRFGQKYFPGGMGGLADSVLQAATLQDAIYTFSTLLRHWMAENQTWLEPDGEITWLCNAADDGFQLQRDASSQCCVLVLIELIRLAAGNEWRPRHVTLEMKPSSTHINVDELSNARVRFHSEITSVAFPTNLLARPISAYKVKISGGILPEIIPEGFLPSLTKLVKDQIIHGFVPGMELTAYAIGVDSRTLRRWLKTSGLTYRRLIDRIRFELADDLLADPKTPLKDISAALGYSSPNNFIRAFHRISGMRPTQYRRWRKEGILFGDKTSQR